MTTTCTIMPPSEKLRILTEVRELFTSADHFCTGGWKSVIDGVEKFCLYGAVQASMGLEEIGVHADHKVSECSLTTAMYEAIPEELGNFDLSYHRARVEQLLAAGASSSHPDVMHHRVQALQGINDGLGRRAVLVVLDNAIAALAEDIHLAAVKLADTVEPERKSLWARLLRRLKGSTSGSV